MGRAANYYEDVINTIPAQTPVQESFNTPSGTVTQPTTQQQNNVKKPPTNLMQTSGGIIEVDKQKKSSIWNVKEQLMDEIITDPMERDVMSRLPYEIANTLIGMPGENEWSEKNLAQKIDYVGNGILKTGVKLIKALPRTILTAIPKASLTVAQGLGYLADKALGLTQPSVPKSFNLPLLGEIRGFAGTYDDAKNAGFSPFMSAVVATGEFAGDLAISASLLEATQAAFRPRLSTVDSAVKGKDVRTLVTKEEPKININAKSSDGKIITGKELNPTFEAIQNPEVSYFQLPKSVAEKYKGNPNNTFLKVSPTGDGMAEFSVVQVRKSLVDQTKDFFSKKFGSSKVVEGKFGPELKLESGMVKYDSSLTKSDIGVTNKLSTENLTTKINQDILKPSNESVANAYQFYSPNIEENISFLDAQKRLTSENQARYKSITEDIDKNIGIKSTQENAIGDWSDGAENTIFNTINNVKNYEELRYSAALKGSVGNQKAVIPFIEDVAGKDSLYITEITNIDINALRNKLDELGIKFRTIISGKNSTKVVVFDQGSQLIDNIKQLGEIYETEIKQINGTGEFLGSWNTRAEGKQSFNKVISEYESKTQGLVSKRDGEGPKYKGVSNNGLVEEPFKGDEFAKKIPEVPSLMAKPIRGFEDKIVSGKQVNQIKALQEERAIDNTTLGIVSKVITGKSNINELTQQEAFNLSQSIYNMPKTGPDSSVKDLGGFINRTWREPARYWMEAVEREMGYPVYSDINVPMNYGMRLMEKDFAVYNAEANKIFGKYSSGKYPEEMRMIDAYSTGDKNAILKNTTLDPTTKADLIKIGDWMVEQYKKLFKELGDLTGTKITSEKWFGNYAPNITDRGGLFNRYKNLDDVPAEIKPFYRFEREGTLSPLVDNPLAKYQMYIRSILKEKYIGKTVERAKEIIAEATSKGSKNVAKATNDYLQEKLGFQDELSSTLNKFGEKLSNQANGFFGKNVVPKDISKKAIDFLMTNSYAGALGGRIMPIVRQLQGLLMDYAEYGPKAFYNGLKNSFKGGAMKSAKDEGFLVEMGLPYGNELVQSSKNNIFNIYNGINRATLKPYGWIDNWTRTVAREANNWKFDESINAFLQGKIDYNTFEIESGISGLNPTMRNIIRGEVTKNTPESLKKAKDLLAQDTIDNTLFPYRRAEASRAHYGLKGKTGLQFSQWIWEYQKTLRSWISRGQWDKLIRFVAASVAMNRTAKETFGIDVEDWSLLGPFTGFPFGPIAKGIFDLTTAAGQALMGQSEDLDKNWQSISRSMKLYGGIATGVAASKLKDFMQSVERYESGVSVSSDPQKPFGVYSTSGKLLRWTDFTGLLLDLMGFQSVEKTEFSDRVKRASIESTKYSNKINKAMNYLVDGKMDKFDKYVSDNNLMINDIYVKLKSYNMPLDQRIFEKLPAELKIKYFNLFYPQ
jgi:hypothetical protein